MFPFVSGTFACPFLWPILCLFSIFAQGFDNVEKWCSCFLLFLALLLGSIFLRYSSSIVVLFPGLYFVLFPFLHKVSTMSKNELSKNDVIVSVCLWHCCLFPSTCGSLVVLLQYCCSFLWPILCPFSIFAQGFDNVEKWCGCFLLFLALLLLSMCLWFGSSIVVLFFGLYFVFFQFFRKVSTMSKNGVFVLIMFVALLLVSIYLWYCSSIVVLSFGLYFLFFQVLRTVSTMSA